MISESNLNSKYSSCFHIFIICCSQTTKCIQVTEVCDGYSNCPLSSEDDENKKICQGATHDESGDYVFPLTLCTTTSLSGNRSTDKYRLLCNLHDMGICKYNTERFL
jgi:hypothetical protein